MFMYVMEIYFWSILFVILDGGHSYGMLWVELYQGYVIGLINLRCINT